MLCCCALERQKETKCSRHLLHIVIAIHRPFRSILSIKWSLTTFIFFMLKETTSESSTSIKMSEAATTDAESKHNYIYLKKAHQG